MKHSPTKVNRESNIDKIDIAGSQSAAEPHPWEIVREFIREIEEPNVLLRTDKQFSSQNWGDRAKGLIAAALRAELASSVPEVKI